MDVIMNELRSQGPAEADLVKRYRFSKINGIDSTNQSELNAILNSSLKQILGTQAGSMIDEVLIPALILADK